MTICVLTESELLHRHGVTAVPGWYVAEEHDGDRVVDVLTDPLTSEAQARHIAHTRYGMEAH